MAGRLNELQSIVVPLGGAEAEPDRMGLDGDTPFPFQVHGVQALLGHLALGQRASHFKQPVGQRRLAVAGLGDNRGIPNVSGIRHGNFGAPVLGGGEPAGGRDTARPLRWSRALVSRKALSKPFENLAKGSYAFDLGKKF